MKKQYQVTLGKTFLFIDGDDKGLELTNDMELIIDDIKSDYGDIDRRIFYRDCFGYIDEIILIDGKFSHFKSYGRIDLDIKCAEK